MYTVKCKECGKEYESKSNRSGFCSDCKTTARSRTNTKYRDSVYEQIMIYVKKGEKAEIKNHAQVLDMSVNELCKTAIWEYIKNEYEKRGINPDKE